MRRGRLEMGRLSAYTVSVLVLLAVVAGAVGPVAATTAVSNPAAGVSDTTAAGTAISQLLTPPEQPQTPELEIEDIDDQFPDGKVGGEYGTAEVTVSETADVETESLRVAVTIASMETEQIVYEAVKDDIELQDETKTFAFEIGSFEAPGTYGAFVTVDSEESDSIYASTEFEVKDRETPSGSIDFEEPISADDEGITVSYTFSNTINDDATVAVGIPDAVVDDVLIEPVTENGSIVVPVEHLGGIEAGDELQAVLFDEPPEDIDRTSESTTALSINEEPPVEGFEPLDVAVADVKPAPEEPVSPAFMVDIDDEMSSLETTPGGEITVVATITNAGDVEGVEELWASVGERSQAESIGLEPGASQSVVFSFVVDEEDDEQQLVLESETDRSTTTVSVKSPESRPGSRPVGSTRFEISVDENESTLEVIDGESIVIVADVANTGNRRGSQLLEAGVHESTKSERVVISPGLTSTVSFTLPADVEHDGRNAFVKSDDENVTVPVSVSHPEPVRTLETPTMASGEATNVSLSIDFATPSNFTIVESFDSFDDVSIVDDDDAAMAGVTDTNDELFATFVERQNATVRYEVTLGHDNPPGRQRFDGTAELVDVTLPTVGIDSLEVTGAETPIATRSFAQETLEPGESTRVSVTVDIADSRDLTIVESFEGISDVQIVDDDGAAVAAVSDSTDELVATYTDREDVTLVYEITAPATDTGTIEGDGSIDIDGVQTTIAGSEAIDVYHRLDLTGERSLEESVVTPGDDVIVTLNVTSETPTSLTVVETIGGFEDVTIVDRDGAEFVRVNHDTGELVATYIDRDAVALSYRARIPENTPTDTHIELDGFVDVAGENTPLGGVGSVTLREFGEIDVLYTETAKIVTDDETGTSVAEFTRESMLRGVSFKTPVTGTVVVTELEREPEGIDPSPDQTIAVTEIRVPGTATNESATVQMRIPRNRLDDAGGTPETAHIDRYTEGSWDRLETTVVETGDETVVIEAQTPGFSYFAVSVAPADVADSSQNLPLPLILLGVAIALLAAAIAAVRWDW
ncbi:PGF-pre-PGF domain-containing protein [Natrialbaceae archaeon A-CW3]